MRKRAIIAPLLIAPVVGWFVTPSIIKYYLENKYDFLKIDKISYNFLEVCFDGIKIRKDNLQANLNKACAKGIRGPLKIDGGTVDIVISESLNTTGNNYSIKEISATNLKLSVKKNNLKVSLSGVSYIKNSKDNFVSFESGIAEYSNRKANIFGGRIERDLSKIKLEQIDTDFTLPFDIPQIKQTNRLIAKKLVFKPKDFTVQIGILDYGFIKAKDIYGEINNKNITANVGSLAMDHSWLASGPVSFSNIIINTQIDSLHELEVVIGSKTVINLDLKQYQIRGNGLCNEWVSALPDPLPVALEGAAENYSGTMSFTVDINPKPKFKLINNCKFKCSSNPIVNLFSGDLFEYSVFDKDNNLFIRKIGPNESGWTSIEGMPPELILAVNSLEDPGFQSHSGVIPLAIQMSLLENLKRGKFSRGGSTITMQLAKNLWLNREKVLLRKVQEIFLAFALESCLTKEQIIEWYLNAVEFGPNVYGIKAGARYYFHKEPYELSAVESFYLAKILPNPKGAVKPDNGGLENARNLMDKLAKTGFVVE